MKNGGALRLTIGKRGRDAVLLLFVFCALSATAQSDQESGLLSFLLSKDLPVVVVTDFTDAGKKFVAPTKESPVYFEALILGYNDWGRAIAGEKIPEKKEMIKLIFKVLADQGYYPCSSAHPPTVILALAWGSMNERIGMSLLFMGGEKYDMLWEVNPGLENQLDARILGRSLRSGDAAMIMSMAGGNLYVASIQAFDEAAAQKDQTVLLWHTKISCPANGFAMDSALRRMIHTAAPLVGRETAKPVINSAPIHDGYVEMGEAKVLEMMDVDQLPITDRTKPENGGNSAQPKKADDRPATRGQDGGAKPQPSDSPAGK